MSIEIKRLAVRTGLGGFMNESMDNSIADRLNELEKREGATIVSVIQFPWAQLRPGEPTGFDLLVIYRKADGKEQGEQSH